MESCDGVEWYEWCDGGGVSDGDDDLYGDGYGCQWLHGYDDGDGDGEHTDGGADGSVDGLYHLLGYGFCGTDADGEWIEPAGGHHGDGPDGL